jgi:hypothetical protein
MFILFRVKASRVMNMNLPPYLDRNDFLLRVNILKLKYQIFCNFNITNKNEQEH